jgi:hypothetical protein
MQARAALALYDFVYERASRHAKTILQLYDNAKEERPWNHELAQSDATQAETELVEVIVEAKLFLEHGFCMLAASTEKKTNPRTMGGMGPAWVCYSAHMLPTIVHVERAFKEKNTASGISRFLVAADSAADAIKKNSNIVERLPPHACEAMMPWFGHSSQNLLEWLGGLKTDAVLGHGQEVGSKLKCLGEPETDLSTMLTDLQTATITRAVASRFFEICISAPGRRFTSNYRQIRDSHQYFNSLRTHAAEQAYGRFDQLASEIGEGLEAGKRLYHVLSTVVALWRSLAAGEKRKVVCAEAESEAKRHNVQLPLPLEMMLRRAELGEKTYV